MKAKALRFFFIVLALSLLLPQYSSIYPSPISNASPVVSTVGQAGGDPNFIVHSATDVTLYSDSVAVNVVWDGVKRFDRLLNNTILDSWNYPPVSYWCKWRVEWFKGSPPATPYVSLVESSVVFNPPFRNSSGIYLIVESTMNDGSIFTVTYKILNNDHRLKWDLSFKASNSWTTKYRLCYEYFTLPCQKTSLSAVKQDVYKYSVNFGEGGSYQITFDYSDVDQAKFPVSETSDTSKTTEHKHYFYIDLGSFSNWETKIIDPSTVGTSTSNEAVIRTTQRKGLVHTASRFWAWYSDGVNLVFSSSTNDITWASPTTERACTAGKYFSVGFDGTYFHYVYSAGSDPAYRRCLPNSDGSVTWSAVAQIIDVGGDSIAVDIAVDSSGYPYISYRVDGTDKLYVVKSSANDGTFPIASGYPLKTSDTVDADGTPSIICVTGSEMLVLWGGTGDDLVGYYYNGATWGSEEDATTSLLEAIGYFSMVADSSGNVHLVFLDSVGHDILYVKRTYSTGLWGAESTAYAGATTTVAPTLSVDTTTNYLYLFWLSDSAVDHVYYKIYTTSWGSVVDWIDETTDDVTKNYDIISSEKSWGGYICVMYETKTGSPYNIRHAYITLNNTPTNDALSLDLTGASYKDSKTLLCAKQDYNFTLKVSDGDGVSNLNYAEIRLDPTGKNVILRWTEATGVFSEQSDASNYVTLNTGSSSAYTTGNQKVIKFYVTVNWAWGDSAETVSVRGYVLDDVSASDTDTYSNIFGVEAHLTFASLVVNDYHASPSQTLTMTGDYHYAGTSVDPPNGDYQVTIHLGVTHKGTIDATLVSGAFSVSDVTAEATIGSSSYTVEGSYQSGAGSFSTVYVEVALNIRALQKDGLTVLSGATVYINNGTQYSLAVGVTGWANFTGQSASPVSAWVTWQGSKVCAVESEALVGSDVNDPITTKAGSVTFSCVDKNNLAQYLDTNTYLAVTFPNTTVKLVTMESNGQVSILCQNGSYTMFAKDFGTVVNSSVATVLDPSLTSSLAIQCDVNVTIDSLALLSNSTYHPQFNATGLCYNNNASSIPAVGSLTVTESSICYGEASITSSFVVLSMNDSYRALSHTLEFNASSLNRWSRTSLTRNYDNLVDNLVATISSSVLQQGIEYGVSISFRNIANYTTQHIHLNQTQVQMRILLSGVVKLTDTGSLFNVTAWGNESRTENFVPTGLDAGSGYILQIRILQSGSSYELASANIYGISIGERPAGNDNSGPLTYTLIVKTVDLSGVVLPNVEVTLTLGQTIKTKTTDDKGEAVFTSLSTGLYAVNVSYYDPNRESKLYTATDFFLDKNAELTLKLFQSQSPLNADFLDFISLYWHYTLASLGILGVVLRFYVYPVFFVSKKPSHHKRGRERK